ncbi:YbbR-like domain-containing protein [Cyclobacterium plantarum]|uniref:YbbR-like domain-containing protein n=1 Tax=Cyclobacterium plantarum TaxID=2716263 RepID=A0ABX0HAZ6_9BACT|nr:YbbR-like domain-containing protein [Cyclobacterium plantarum]NHE59069.1 YbbR-like domain-containing protein [Cyclobacterium plantarum]
MSTLGKYFRKLKPEKTSNLKVVVLCVFTASTFWLLNALNKDNYTTTVTQPVVIDYDKEEYMAVSGVPREIRISINGNGWDLLKRHFKMGVTEFEIWLEEPSRQPYLLTSDIESQLSEHIASTNLVDIVQDTLFYQIDKIVSKRIQLVADTTENTLAENHAFASAIEIEPKTVMVTGPISIIEQLEGKLRVPLGERNIEDDFSRLLPLELDRELDRYLSLDEETAQISFMVEEFLENTLQLEINKLYFPNNVDINSDITEVRVNLYVKESRLEDFQNLELAATLNYNNRNREDSTISVSLNTAPDYIRDVSFEPESFKLTYE